MFATAREQEVLQSLIDQKLLVSNREGDDATVEVAHEALFSSWERLRDWIEAGKQVIFAKNRLADDARRWQHRQEEGDTGADEELITGSRLAQALDMRARGDFLTVVGGLAALETRFLDASLAQRDQRAQEEDARQQRELEAAKRLAAAQKAAAGRLRIGLAVAVVLLLAVAGLAWSAYQSKQKAIAAQQQAETEKGKAVAAQQLAESEKQKAVAAQERTVREMIEASWKGGLYLQEDNASVLTDAKADRKQQDLAAAAAASYLSGGPRSLYAHLKTLMDLEKMKSLAPVPIFLSGPHAKDFTFRSYQFGRYNPEFVRWAGANLIPAASNPAFRDLTAPVYHKHLKEVARVYFLAHQYVAQHGTEVKTLQAQYVASIDEYRDKPYDEQIPGPGDVLQAVFADSFADLFLKKNDLNAFFGTAKGNPSARLSYSWITNDDQYFASTAVGFWIRREIDGTAPDFFAGLKKLLETYDAAFLKDPAAP
jgi:hypothetical protein